MVRWLGFTSFALLAACAALADGAGESIQESETSGEDGFVCDESSSGASHGDVDDNGEGHVSGGGEDGTDGMADDLPVGALVSEVRMGSFPAGTLVDITDFVVSTPVVRSTTGEGWLVHGQTAAGGPYSGIRVVVGYDDPIVETFVPGTALRVVGVVVTRGGRASLWVHPADGGELLHRGVGPAPEPEAFTTEELIAGGVADPFDAVLVRIEDVEVQDPEICVGTFAVEDGVRIDDLFLGALAPMPSAGATFSAVVGPLFDKAAGVEIAPRTPDDLVN